MTNFALIQTGSNYVENIIIRDNEFDISGFTMVKNRKWCFLPAGYVFKIKLMVYFIKTKGLV